MSFCLTIVRGSLSSAPDIRVLDSGARLATLQVTVREADRPTISVPITVWDPPSIVEALATGDDVVAVGYVNRRFFGVAGGPRQSKVEIVATEIARGVDNRRVAAAFRKARVRLEALTTK